MAFGSGAPKINAKAMPKSVGAKPHFPVGSTPSNVYGARINDHPPLMDGSSSTKAPRMYGKQKGSGFTPFGGI